MSIYKIRSTIKKEVVGTSEPAYWATVGDVFVACEGDAFAAASLYRKEMTGKTWKEKARGERGEEVLEKFKCLDVRIEGVEWVSRLDYIFKG